MRLPLLITAAVLAALAVPETAAAAPPPNDNYLASSTIADQEYTDSVDTTEATTQSDLFNPNRDGLPFGAGVWGSGYVVLPAMKLYEPIWKYDVKTLANDLSAHLVYGVATAAGMQALNRR